MTSRPARENPFRVSRIESLRYRLDEAGWRGLLARLTELKYRAALVGPEGSGKTTLLEDLEQRLADEGWRIARVRLRRERPRPTAEEWASVARADGQCLITVDGVEQLAWWRWRGLKWRGRHAGGLVVTSHRSGRLPTLRRHATSRSLLLELVAELVGQEAACDLRTDLERLFELHGGNLRSCLRGLYDRWALSPNREITG